MKKDKPREYENGSHLPRAFVSSLSDRVFNCWNKSLVGSSSVIQHRGNTPHMIHHLTKNKTANIKRSIMFSKCNQFLPAGSKLSAARHTKSHRGHQIHANPSLHHHTAGGEGQSEARHISRLCTNTTWSQSLAPGVVRWNTLKQTELRGLRARALLTLTSLWHMMWDNM